MTDHSGKWEQVENELAEIAAEITALGDMLPVLIQYGEDMEPGTPKGIKILLADIRKHIEDLRKYVGRNSHSHEEGKRGLSS
jgi:hypothetical protein